MELGKVIADYTRKHEISARHFSRNAGLSHTHVKDIMNGKNIEPSIATLRGIASAMRVTLLELLLAAGYATKEDIEQYITKGQLEKILPPEYKFLLESNKIEYLKLAEFADREQITPEYLTKLLDLITRFDKK